MLVQESNLGHLSCSTDQFIHSATESGKSLVREPCCLRIHLLVVPQLWQLNMEKEVCQRNLHHMVVKELTQRFSYFDGSVPFPLRCETQVHICTVRTNFGGCNRDSFIHSCIRHYNIYRTFSIKLVLQKLWSRNYDGSIS